MPSASDNGSLSASLSSRSRSSSRSRKSTTSSKRSSSSSFVPTLGSGSSSSSGSLSPDATPSASLSPSQSASDSLLPIPNPIPIATPISGATPSPLPNRTLVAAVVASIVGTLLISALLCVVLFRIGRARRRRRMRGSMYLIRGGQGREVDMSEDMGIGMAPYKRERMGHTDAEADSAFTPAAVPLPGTPTSASAASTIGPGTVATTANSALAPKPPHYSVRGRERHESTQSTLVAEWRGTYYQELEVDAGPEVLEVTNAATEAAVAGIGTRTEAEVGKETGVGAGARHMASASTMASAYSRASFTWAPAGLDDVGPETYSHAPPGISAPLEAAFGGTGAETRQI